MATPLVTSIQKELDDIESAYADHFAGQSRATREISKMDDLIKRSKAVLDRIGTVPAAAMGKDLQALSETAAQQLSLYQNERKAIEQAKIPVPGADTFGPLATVANFTFAKYRRHFAGKARSTRDVGLAEELIDDLRKIESAMKAVISKTPSQPFRDDLNIVQQNLQMYESELKEIKKAREAGTTEERGSALAQGANELFAIYREHFAGLSRTTRRPQLLQRAITGLEAIQAGMQALEKQADKPDFNAANLQIVTDNLNVYRLELVEIRAAREQTKIEDLMGMLGDAANACFQGYRDAFAGKSRTTVSRDTLTTLADRLDELHRQMRDLHRVNKNEMNAKNMDIVAEQLAMFNDEWEKITEAQKL